MLHEAAKEGYTPVFELLLNYTKKIDGNIDTIDIRHWTPLTFAMLYTNASVLDAIEMAKTAISYGADPNQLFCPTEDPKYFRPLLHGVYFNQFRQHKLGDSLMVSFANKVCCHAAHNSEGQSMDEFVAALQYLSQLDRDTAVRCTLATQLTVQE